MNNKTKLTLISVFALAIIIGLAGISYAFFSDPNATGNEMTITSGTMSLSITDGQAVEFLNMVPGNHLDKTFTVTNTGTVTTTYDVYLSEVINNFADKSDLVYELISNDGGYETEEPVQVPSGPAKIVNQKSIAGQTSHHYTLRITFVNKNTSQNSNMGKTFRAKVNLNEYHDITTTTNYYLDNTLVTDMPDNTHGYLSASSSCNNGALISFDDTNWTYDILNITQNNTTCNLYFETLMQNAAQFISSKLGTDNSVVEDSTSDQNIRYVGRDVNNYVEFNCDNNGENCELWRIIGVFGDNVKIIRDEELGEIGFGSPNTWATSYIRDQLNTTYFNSLSKLTKSMIDIHEAKGGKVPFNATVLNAYNAENSNSNMSSEYITMMYASDFGYAAGPDCWDKTMRALDGTCKTNNWMFKTEEEWTKTGISDNNNDVLVIHQNNGLCNLLSSGSGSHIYYRPVVFLNRDVMISNPSSTGSEDDPYKLYAQSTFKRYLINKIGSDNSITYDQTTHNNIRYVGNSVNNYVKFNCDNNGENCELWRIIGVLDNGVKIVKAELEESMVQFHSSSTRTAWANSSLYDSLNNTYYSNMSNRTKSMIESHRWGEGTVTYLAATSGGYYETESSSRFSYPAANIGLINVSDYLFSSTSDCWNTYANEYSTSCRDKGWLYQGNEWTLDTYYNQSSYTSYKIVTSGGNLNSIYPSQTTYYRPSLFLKQEVNNIRGDGSYDHPYVVSYN